MPTIDILEEAAAKLPHSTRKMFGGHGLFAPNGGMFAGVVDDDKIVLKFVDGTVDHDAFLSVGGKPWIYEGKMGGATMKQWLVVPNEYYDDLLELSSWLARAHKRAPAKGAKAAKKASGKKLAKKAANLKKVAKKRVK